MKESDLKLLKESVLRSVRYELDSAVRCLEKTAQGMVAYFKLREAGVRFTIKPSEYAIRNASFYIERDSLIAARKALGRFNPKATSRSVHYDDHGKASHDKVEVTVQPQDEDFSLVKLTYVAPFHSSRCRIVTTEYRSDALVCSR